MENSNQEGGNQLVKLENNKILEIINSTVEIEMKGGDTNLIIPVLVIAGIVIIAALVIVFWKH